MDLRIVGAVSAALLLLVGTPSAGQAPDAYPTKGPITIDSRDDWTKHGLPGNGTEDDPFRIEHILIDARTDKRDKIGLSIDGVPDHAVVSDVLILGGKVGFALRGAPNVTVENVTVRRALTGFDLVGAHVSHVSVSGGDTGIVATESGIKDAYVARNSVGIRGVNLSLEDVVLDANAVGIQLMEQTPASTTYVNRTTIVGARAVGIQARGVVDVSESVFEGNVNGVRYYGQGESHRAGTTTTYHEHYPLTIEASAFGAHSENAILVERPARQNGAIISPKVAAVGNWWGIGADGLPAEPSPFGFGPPISDGDVIEYAPVLSEHPSAGGATNGSIHSVPPPNVTVADATVSPVSGGREALVRIDIRDPLGIENWTLRVGSQVIHATPEGATDAVAARRVMLEGNATTIQARLDATNVFGRIATWNATVAPAPPPAVEEDSDAVSPPSPPADPAESDALGLVLVVAVVGAAARLQRKRGI